MKSKGTFLCAALFFVVSTAPVAAQEARFGLGLYVVVNDMAESRDYYRRLFEAEPIHDLEDFVAFNLNGGLFSLFAEAAFEHPLKRGNGVVPYILVSDIDTEYARVRAFTETMIHESVVDEGPIKLFMFLDPSGNPVEFYSLTAEQRPE